MHWEQWEKEQAAKRQQAQGVHGKKGGLPSRGIQRKGRTTHNRQHETRNRLAKRAEVSTHKIELGLTLCSFSFQTP